MKKLVAIIFVALTAAMCALLCTGCAASGYTVFEPVAVFSDDILFSARIMGARAQNAHTRMVEIIREIDAQVSATDPNSDVSRFNAAPADAPIEIGEHTYALFELCKSIAAEFGTAFDPSKAPLVELWHIDAQSIGSYSADELPAPERVREVLSYCDMSKISCFCGGGKKYLSKSDGRVKLDFGGVAKGYAVDKCVAALDEYAVSSALLDISGNVFFYGDRVSGDGDTMWNVGIVAPRPRRSGGERGYVCAFSTTGGSSAATSGDYMRYNTYETDSGALYVPHIIGEDGAPIGVVWDGDSGAWKNSGDNVISATVIGASSAVCDALSTAAAALGFEAGARLIRNSGYKGLIFTEKEYTIVGDAALFKPDVYDGFRAYEYRAL